VAQMMIDVHGCLKPSLILAQTMGCNRVIIYLFNQIA
jgi:hypothetical protein